MGKARTTTPTRSELECFVLGLIWQFGPCSPYDVRRHLQASPSTQWSGSAGAIYPLIQRLERAGLVSAASRQHGQRARKEYRLTPSGQRSLRAWIGPELGEEAVTVVHDPLRSRARFLGALTPKERVAWVASAKRVLDDVETKVRAWHARFGSPETQDVFARILTDHGMRDVNGRRAWLQTVAKCMPLMEITRVANSAGASKRRGRSS